MKLFYTILSGLLLMISSGHSASYAHRAHRAIVSLSLQQESTHHLFPKTYLSGNSSNDDESEIDQDITFCENQLLFFINNRTSNKNYTKNLVYRTICPYLIDLPPPPSY